MYANNRSRLKKVLGLRFEDELPAGLVRQVELVEEGLEKLNQHHKLSDGMVALVASSYVIMEEEPAKDKTPEDPFPQDPKKDEKKPAAGKKG